MPGFVARQLSNVARLGKSMVKNPVTTVGTVSTGLAAQQAVPDAKALEADIMRNRIGAPGGRYVFAELESLDRRKGFLHKVASPLLKVAEGGATDVLTGGFLSGAGKETAKHTIEGVSNLIRGAGQGIRNKVKLEPQRKQIMSDMSDDPVVQEYEVENPGASAAAYESMKRFAPELSTDPAVVKSYLREAAQTGGAINYMTIKQLAETEAAINKAQGREPV
jgi:hypothetical protein